MLYAICNFHRNIPAREMDKKSKGSPQTRFQTSDLSISSICFPPTKIKRKNVSKWQVVREENKSDLFVGILLQKASKSGLHLDSRKLKMLTFTCCEMCTMIVCSNAWHLPGIDRPMSIYLVAQILYLKTDEKPDICLELSKSGEQTQRKVWNVICNSDDGLMGLKKISCCSLKLYRECHLSIKISLFTPHISR